MNKKIAAFGYGILILVIGVAVLADISCIILTENAALDEDAKKRAEENDVVILTTSKNSYQLATEISKLI